MVNLSRLQASRYVAARVLAPSSEALDTPLGPPRSLAVPGVCYSALRRLPRRDLHPLETNSVKQTLTSASSRRENGSFYAEAGAQSICFTLFVSSGCKSRLGKHRSAE